EVGGGQLVGGARQVGDQLGELRHVLGGGGAGEDVGGLPAGRRERHAVARRPGGEVLLAGGADAALGAVEDAAPRHVVGRVQRGAGVAQHVLHLAPVVEADAADDARRDAGAAQRLL